jgi:hypothetical protein
MVIPDMALVASRPLVIYQHGTTNGRNDVPSRQAAGTSEALSYGSMGYVAIAPDYLGLGDSRGFHPYVHAATQASAGLEMLFAAAEWLEADIGDAWIGDVFVSGYSQGGHAAAALQRELEQNWSLVFPVKASTPMSGPYSISGVMYDRIIGDEVYFTPAYIAYVALGYQEVYGNIFTQVSDLFKPAYVPAIESFRNGQTTLTAMNSLLVGQLILNGGIMPKRMFKDSVFLSLTTDENHPLRLALRDNDTYDWTPQAPTRLYYCTADEQVPFRNALVADSVMNANGAPDVMSTNFGNLNHGGCATPAISASISFFDSFYLPSAVEKIQQAEFAQFIQPNPVNDVLKFNNAYQIDALELYHAFGNGIKVDISQHQVYVGHLPAGMYIAVARTGDLYIQQKVILLH